MNHLWALHLGRVDIGLHFKKKFTCSWRATSIIWFRSVLGLASMSLSECSCVANQLLILLRSASSCSQWLANCSRPTARCSAHWHTWLHLSPRAESWSSIWEQSSKIKINKQGTIKKTKVIRKMKHESYLLSPAADSSTMTTMSERALTYSCFASKSFCRDSWSSSKRTAAAALSGCWAAPNWEMRSSVAVSHWRNLSNCSCCSFVRLSWIL